MLSHAALIISIFLGALYALGLSFYQGYMQEFGIIEAQFPLTVDRTFFQGFISSIVMSPKGIVYLFFSSAGIVLIAELASIASAWIRNKNLNLNVLKNFSVGEGNSKENSFLVFSQKTFLWIGLFFILYIGLILTLTLSSRAGVEAAKNFKSDSANGLRSQSIVMLKSGEELFGFSITCNSSQCAYFLGSETVVLNNNDVERVVNKVKSPNKNFQRTN